MKEEYLLSSTWAKRLQRFLILLLALRIISYFVLTDNIVIVQVTKASLRVFITLLLSVILFFQSRINNPKKSKFLQVAPWVLYGLYPEITIESYCINLFRSMVEISKSAYF